ncbi:MauE/DoxX family redox-associated membrane protein [Ornithobacterium rhinotracheale]|uniref:MauE/DoxX family redox-associated membrane protein n=1 Tax=Ornithobacterium rhinotracheale TaxID=28251 RepID=UPI00129D000F|nr:MauE/DoxX family redox-associated membrane protein [Ornithobacterium rhinotracheale]MRI62390.1 DoxX family membrane protein [Ornithobacterium rhinotracheale]MRJ09492.1 DoxX family membrane protein [Ornithobacterium rhinotracheale]
MKIKNVLIIEWLVRLALSASFLSAVADRFELWPKDISTWGNWYNFVQYTQNLLYFIPPQWGIWAAYIATSLEIILGVLLLIPFKTKWVANTSGFLLLSFAISMLISLGLKPCLDYSVFTAIGASFALGLITKNH